MNEVFLCGYDRRNVPVTVHSALIVIQIKSLSVW